MHYNLVLGACVAGLQFVTANVAQHRGHPTKWVTEIKTVKGHLPVPTNFDHGNAPNPWLNAWPPHDGMTKRPHQGSKDSDSDDKPKKHHKGKGKHGKGGKKDDNDDDKPKHDKGKGKGNKKHHKDNDKPNKPKHHKGDNKPNKPKHHKDDDSKSDKPKPYKGDKPKHNKPFHTKGGNHGLKLDYDDGNEGDTLDNTEGSYKSQVLECHNVHRANHSSPPVTWSNEIAATAAKIAKRCVFEHVMGIDGGKYGQNIAAGAQAGGISHVISDQFYNAEINDFGNQYGDEHPSGFEQWGHFSQLVWKNTREVGCATVHCPGGVGNTGKHVPPYFTVCNYKPPGNIAGAYPQNVLKPLGRPTVRGHGVKGNH